MSVNWFRDSGTARSTLSPRFSFCRDVPLSKVNYWDFYWTWKRTEMKLTQISPKQHNTWQQKSPLKPGVTIPLQVPTRTIRSNSDIHTDPNICEKITSQDNSFGVTSHQFEVQNTSTLLLSQFIRTQRNIPMCIPISEYFNQIQNSETVTKQAKRSNGQTIVLNALTTTVPTLSRYLLIQLNIADTYTLSGSNKNPFQTITNLNATEKPCQSLYQPDTAPNIGPSAILPSSSSTVDPRNFSSISTKKTILYFLLQWTNWWKFLMELTIKILLKNIYIKFMQTWFQLWENKFSILWLIFDGTNKKRHLAMFLIWKCFKLVFATSWKVLNWLVRLCICIYKNAIFFTKKCIIRKSWSSGLNEKSNWKRT